MTFHVIGPIKYGYPTGQNPEPNVKAQWLFNEAAGNLVDVVSSYSLDTFAGTFSYQYAATGRFTPISPGFNFGENAANHAFGSSALSVGASDDLVIEAWIQPLYQTYAPLINNIVLSTGGAPPRLFIQTYQFPGSFLDVALNDGAGHSRRETYNLPSSWPTDNIPHHIRVRLLRSSGWSLYVDGDLMTLSSVGGGSSAYSSFGAYSFDRTSIEPTIDTTYYELRVSIGTDVSNNRSYPANNFHIADPTHL